jgi:DNA-binding MarR family transcriptional regulator
MVATARGGRQEAVARELFEVLTQLGVAARRGRRRDGGLKEVEFHALAILQERGTMIVGDIQRLLGVLPAQMSRIIRSLENRPEPLISCQINPRDKRKIDVQLTDAGEKAFADFQTIRVRRIADQLQDLSEDEQEHLLQILDRLHGMLERV